MLYVCAVLCVADCGVKDLTIPEQQELGYMPLRDDLERVITGIYRNIQLA